MNQTGTLRIDLTLKANADLLRFGSKDDLTRQLIFPISFTSPFASPPIVMVAVSGLTSDGKLVVKSNHANDIKFALLPRNITTHDFNILLTIHRGDTTESIDVSWIALTA